MHLDAVRWQGQVMDTSQTTGTPARSAREGRSARPGDLSLRRRRATRVASIAVSGILLVASSGCSGETAETPLEAAQADVAAAQEALAAAEAEAAASAAAFCSASSEYISALDRYGDVLNETAVTVGDVTAAGSDLTEPREETLTAGEDAVSAQEAVAQAQHDLAAAEAALAAAQGSAPAEAPSEPETSPVATEVPAPPPATVARVDQAESEFADAHAGITAQTPLAQAGEQFNAAAVALEMAWLQLFAASGCLSEEQQVQAATAVRDYTIALQQALTETGYYTGQVDGVYGPQTVDAVTGLQAANGLPQTGTVDKATEAALQAELDALGAAAAQEATATTAALQQTLRLAGYWDGPVDGVWSDALTAALMEFQGDLGLPATGALDAATIAAFQQAIADRQQTPTPSPTAEPSVAPSPTNP